MIFLKSAICHKIAKKDHRKSVNIRDENCATLSLPSLKWGNIKKSLFLHVSPSSGKTHSAPHAMTSVKFYSIYLSRPPSTGAECACRNDKWGWLWFFMDFNWPYRNDADINISFNDVFALKAIISIFISQRLRVPRWQISYGRIMADLLVCCRRYFSKPHHRGILHDMKNNWWWRRSVSADENDDVGKANFHFNVKALNPFLFCIFIRLKSPPPFWN